ncbi:histidinol dehydrogenase [Alloacidobacterium dinghuense]|uniref:Histidinol dehydrogenase n=1 Tax=Alloacidobacterium dinghuense TaxID=2763107 RepID=A0A7G8BEU4_9BACT|nr:histidinol dehydrogenase [Alloacidobacterium dinghuense]QNI31064.1 histidinol dehydrogenase [Alloacidobacterium dinghuense]
MKVLHTSGRNARRARAAIARLESRRTAVDERATPVARRIIDSVRKGGDAALRRYAVRLDGISQQLPLRISEDELKQAWRDASPAFRTAIQAAAKNIRRFAQRQMPKAWRFEQVPGLTVGQEVRPLESVGCYVPSGRYPLPSTMLMTVIPAQVAGVRRIVVVSPKPAAETLAVAGFLGIAEFYRIGGAQAVAALANGTESIPRVDKIVGPGNAYVTAAKKLVSFDCAIDMLAGPTEIVVTSENGDPTGIAADLVAQAEHDPDAVAVFITAKAALAERVRSEVDRLATKNPIAKKAIQSNGAIFVTDSVTESRALTNRLAPEHLTVDAESDLEWIRNAGSVFVGRYSAQPLGDYISGPNHTLPTSGWARTRGGLSVSDFLKVITVQTFQREGIQQLGPPAIVLAEAEGLLGHAEAIRVRGVDG